MVEDEKQAPLLESIGNKLCRGVEKWMPDPIIFALLLLFGVFILGMTVQEQDPYALAGFSYLGFWKLLTFAMQVVLQVVLGFALASHPFIRGGLKLICQWPSNGKQAAALIACITLMVSWVYWSLGVVIGAFLAREMAIQAHRRNIPMHYPVLAVSGYVGLGLIWHWGLSGSAPLMATTDGYAFQKLTGLIPLSETVLHPYTLINAAIIFVFGVAVMYFLHPRPAGCRGIQDYVPEALKDEIETVEEKGSQVFADRLENSKIIAAITSIIMLTMIIWWFTEKGGLNLNSLNFVFLLLGFALYLNPIKYLNAIADSMRAVTGIVIQFPFYAAIMGIMTMSGLALTIAGWLTAIATPSTFPVVAWLTGGLVNMFIPSGGGEWVTIGEAINRAAMDLGIAPGQALIAYAAGDAWTNMLQPFWAIPLLAITGLKARNIFGYAIIVWLLATIPFALGLSFVPY